MIKVFQVDGMTCQGCVASVNRKLSELPDVEQITIDLEIGQAEVKMKRHIPLSVLKESLPDKYSLTEINNSVNDSHDYGSEKDSSSPSKLKQLRPLLLIFAYLFVASILLNYQTWNIQEFMLDFMGLFFIVFSFFKFLDLKGFPQSFQMYDPLAKRLPAYGYLYPFLELALGLMFLMRFQLLTALIATIIVLIITTIGVANVLLDKKTVRCACLGTALNLPMTEATFIENTVMLGMAITMIFFL